MTRLTSAGHRRSDFLSIVMVGGVPYWVAHVESSTAVHLARVSKWEWRGVRLKRWLRRRGL